MMTKSSQSSEQQSICNSLTFTINGLFDTDQECMENQLLMYQKGCCPKPPFDFCTYCDDPLIDANMDMIVPTGQFVGADQYTCYDYKYQNEAMIGMFTDGTCEDTFMRRAGHYCGCGPTQLQQCHLCPDKQPPSKPQKTDAWVTNSDCRGIEYLFSLLKEDECSSLPFYAGADLSIYCGCGGLNQTEIDEQAENFQCTLCGDGNGNYNGNGNGNNVYSVNGDQNAVYAVTNPDFVYTNPENGDLFPKTCRQAEEFAATIIKTPAGCRNPNYFGAAREGCICPGSSSNGVSSSSSTTTISMMMIMSSLTTTMILLLLLVL